MPIPDFQTLMLPLLQQFSDGKEHSMHEVLDNLTKLFSLTEQELSELIPSGKQTSFYNRVGWARTYLAQSGLLEMTRRIHYKITPRGQDVLKSNPPRIDMKYLERFPEYLQFRDRETGRRKRGSEESENTDSLKGHAITTRTPEEILEDAYLDIRNNLAQELLALVKKSPPAFFERLVVELLVNMGYGGSRREAARAVGQSGDEGVDGIIDEDRLGLDIIYIQAKKGFCCGKARDSEICRRADGQTGSKRHLYYHIQFYG